MNRYLSGEDLLLSKASWNWRAAFSHGESLLMRKIFLSGVELDWQCVCAGP